MPLRILAVLLVTAQLFTPSAIADDHTETLDVENTIGIVVGCSFPRGNLDLEAADPFCYYTHTAKTVTEFPDVFEQVLEIMGTEPWFEPYMRPVGDVLALSVRILNDVWEIANS